MERFTKFSAVFALAAGICIPVLWIYFIFSGTIPEIHVEPTAAVFLIISEFITAILLLTGGIGILLKKNWSRKLWFLSMGMLLYAVINATGQFLQINHPFFEAFFIVISAASACVILLSFLVKE